MDICSSRPRQECGGRPSGRPPHRIKDYPSEASEAVPRWEFPLLTLGINNYWLIQPELQLCFRLQVNVPLPREIRHGRPSPCANRPTYKRALAAGCSRADQCASASSAPNPRPIALLVVSASAVGTRRSQVIRLTVQLHRFQRKLQLRPSHQMAGWTCIHNQPFHRRSLWNNRLVVQYHRFGNPTLEIIPPPVPVAGNSLIQRHMAPCFLRNLNRNRASCKCDRSRDQAGGKQDN